MELDHTLSSRYVCTFDDIMQLLCTRGIDTLLSMCGKSGVDNYIEMLFDLLPYHQHERFAAKPNPIGVKINEVLNAVKRYNFARQEYERTLECNGTKGKLYDEWHVACNGHHNIHVQRLIDVIYKYKPADIPADILPESLNLYALINRLVDKLNSTLLIDREDIIIEHIAECLACINTIPKLSTQELHDFETCLEKHTWNVSRNNFFKKPDLQAIVLDLNALLNKYSIPSPKDIVYNDSTDAIEFMKLTLGLELNYEARGSGKFNYTTFEKLYHKKYKESSIFQALFKCFITYGLRCKNFNKEIFEANVRFIKDEFIKPAPVMTDPINIQIPHFDVIEKLEEGDPIIEVIQQLIKNLCKNRMGSSLTPYVLKYETLIEDFQAENKQVTVLISLVLAKYGWKAKAGFKTAPEREALVTELIDVTSAYILQ